MNSIDGIIAICALLAGFGLIIGAINEEKNNMSEANNSIKANLTAETCGAIIDGIYSNSAEEYTKEIPCTTKENLVMMGSGNKTKSFEIITRATKTSILQVKTQPHYLD
jgi:hypothetical protein